MIWSLNHPDVGPSVFKNTAKLSPYQSILDNCDMMNEHLTVEAIEKETIDTSHLGAVKMSKEEALQLFKEDLVLLGSNENVSELEHFKYVVGIAVGRIIDEARSEASKLKTLLPAHHKHQNSSKKLHSFFLIRNLLIRNVRLIFWKS